MTQVLPLAVLLCCTVAAPPPASPARIGPVTLADADGKAHSSSDWKASPAVVLFFLGTECPVSNGYSPEMARLVAYYGPRGVTFLGVHPDPDVRADDARRHAKDYSLPFPVLLDPHHLLTGPAGVELVPEAVVLGRNGSVLYRGRIDDRYGPDGRKREVARTRDVAVALDEILAGKSVARPAARGFGCPVPGPARRNP